MEVGGLFVRVRRLGSGRPVVLVHGLGVSSSYFGPLAEQLAARMRVVAPDLPGSGRSDRPNAVLDIGSAAEVIAEVIIAEELGSPILVANSLGCQFVVELADRRPDLVGALVLISPTVDPRYRSPARQTLGLALDCAREPAGLWPIIVRDYWRMGPRRLLATSLLALEDRPEDKLPRIAAPVLVLRGDHDAITTPEWAERCARLALDGRYVSIQRRACSAFLPPSRGREARPIVRLGTRGSPPLARPEPRPSERGSPWGSRESERSPEPPATGLLKCLAPVGRPPPTRGGSERPLFRPRAWRLPRRRVVRLEGCSPVRRVRRLLRASTEIPGALGPGTRSTAIRT